MAEYDNPRPSSQPIGSTDLVVAKDNLISTDIFVNSEAFTFVNRKGVTKKTIAGIEKDASEAVSGAGYQIIGDFSDATKQTITKGSQAYTSKLIAGFESSIWRTIEQLPYTPTGSDPTSAPELGKWALISSAELQTVAISLNVSDDTVIDGRSGNVITDNVEYIRSLSQQKTYSVPVSARGKSIYTLVDDVLITSDQLSYQLNEVIGTDSVLKTVALSLNVTKEVVVLSTNTTTPLDSILYIHDAVTQKTWKKPVGIGADETIVSVSASGVLTTNTDATYQLIAMTNEQNVIVGEISRPFSFTVAAGQTNFILAESFGNTPTVIALSIDGRMQDALGSNGDLPSYTVSGRVITISEPLADGTKITGVANTLSQTAYPPVQQGDRPGSIGNPYEFATTTDLITSTSMIVGDYAVTRGDRSELDGANATYIIVDNNAVGGTADGYNIINLGDKKAFLLYSGKTTNPTDGGFMKQQNYPYEFDYPSTELELQEANRNIANNSIGIGGATWWSRPISVGRVENGVDVIYKGDTYGTPENRELDDPNMDAVLLINKRLGEAAIKLTRIEMTATPTYTARGLVDKLISNREDEHHTPSVWFNNTGGNIITSWGARNNARFQDGTDATTVNSVRYGQNLATLSTSETIIHPSTTDYAMGFFVGNTSYIFQRENIGNWHYTRSSGGQNVQTAVQFFDSEEGQFYFCLSAIDKTIVSTIDPSSSTDFTKVHMFGVAHGTANPDGKLYYGMASFYPTTVKPIPFDDGGLYATKVDGVTPLSGSNGKMDSTFAAFTRDKLDVALTLPVGKSLRLLDVQYGETPRALIATFDFDWVHGASVPFGKTYDLMIVSWNGSTWDTLTVATGLRGILGYKPQAGANNELLQPTGALGVEGFTSFYTLGASFYRGENHLDLEPEIYYCDRIGASKSGHRLNKITLAPDYLSVVGTEVLLTEYSNILYRPEMTLYGKKRILWYNDAQGWSSFNSWTSETKFLDLTPGA